MVTVVDGYVEIDAKGKPVIKGTGIKVRTIACDHIAYGWDAEAIQKVHSHLSLDQVQAALAYYQDHKAEIERDIAKRYDLVQKIRAGQPDSPGRRKLREYGLIPSPRAV